MNIMGCDTISPLKGFRLEIECVTPFRVVEIFFLKKHGHCGCSCSVVDRKHDNGGCLSYMFQTMLSLCSDQDSVFACYYCRLGFFPEGVRLDVPFLRNYSPCFSSTW